MIVAGPDIVHQPRPRGRDRARIASASLSLGNALDFYSEWDRPTCIISDGPYGLGKYPGEAPTPDGLRELYMPHVAAWAQHAGPDTTLWFWNSELGWATVHPVLESQGWQY